MSLVLSIAVPLGALLLLALGLRGAPVPRPGCVGAGGIALVALTWGMFALGRQGGYAGLAAPWLLAPATAGALAAAVWLARALPGWRKLAAGALLVAVPGTLLAAFTLGWVAGELRADGAARASLGAVAAGLEGYRRDTGRYPAGPPVLAAGATYRRPGDRPTPAEACGVARSWELLRLYAATPERYTIGCWYWAGGASDLLGPRVCLRNSERPEAVCRFGAWGPFRASGAPP